MKATDIFIEYHGFVNLIDDYLEAKEKAEKFKNSLSRHELVMIERKLKIAISKFRMTNQLARKPKPQTYQGGFNFLGR